MPPRPFLILAAGSLLAACTANSSIEPPAGAAPEPAATPEPEPAPTTLEEAIAWFVKDPTEQQALLADLDREGAALAQAFSAHGPADPQRVQALLRAHVEQRLLGWVAKDRQADFPVDAERIRRQAIRWDRLRLEAYVGSGVFPKTYFGYFDEAWDTAGYERTLRETTVCSRKIINAWQRERGAQVRVTDAEIAVTFVAEGGALLLTTDQDRIDTLHPVMDVGLDDLASGLGDYDDLLTRLDAGCGTDLRGTVTYTAPGVQPEGLDQRLAAPEGQWAWLVRYASYEEGIVGTALMWAWEKEIAARKLAEGGRTPMQDRPLDQQFIIGSLVYNSGLVHGEAAARRIAAFEGGAITHDTSERNAHRRPRLNMLPPSEQLGELLEEGRFRDQPTSWLAVYHILQRYGGWEGLRRYSDVFDDAGMYRAGGAPEPASSH
jgi:hypothetical protein